MRECLASVLPWLFAGGLGEPVHRVQAWVLASNTRSRRLLAWLGFHVESHRASFRLFSRLAWLGAVMALRRILTKRNVDMKKLAFNRDDDTFTTYHYLMIAGPSEAEYVNCPWLSANILSSAIL